MKLEQFNTIVNDTLKQCSDTLCSKSKEYATEDRLHNFKVASELMGCTNKQALFGMMTKHIVSIADMCMSDKDYPMEMWQEKIGDNINYLLLLKAIVTEDEENITTVDYYVEGELIHQEVRRNHET